MNINFIGKEFEKLEKADNYINYEFEPKTNIKYGKRNIYFDEIKHEFINDLNIYGFSPYILQSFAEQRDDPNINRFIKKKFNYGYTNYIKIKSRNVIPFSKRLHKKIKIKTKKEEKTDSIKLISDIFLIRKEKDKNIQLEEEKGNFLKKVLEGMGGYRLNINNEEDIKRPENKNKNKKDDITNSINFLKRMKGKDNIELIKDILLVNEKKEKNKSLSFNNIDIFGNHTTKNNTKLKIKNIRQFFENIQKNLNINHPRKSVLTLTKNKYILGNKRLFSSISSRNVHSVEASSSHRKRKNINKINSVEIHKKLFKENKNKFLLFTKAIPYKYLGYTRTHK